MFAIQAAIKYTGNNTGRCLFLGVIVFVMAVASVIAYRTGNAGSKSETAADTIELTCDIGIDENDGISIYRLTVAGYLRADDAYADEIPPVVSRSFDLVTDGSIRSIENIVLSARINGDLEDIQYDIVYAVLEEVDIGGTIS